MKALAEQIHDIDGLEIYVRVVVVRGLMVEVAGPIHAMSVGARLTIETGAGAGIPCEVVGFSDGQALAMSFAALDDVRRGCRAVVSCSTPWASRSTAMPHCWQGRRCTRSVPRRRRCISPGVSASRSISVCVRSIPSLPSAATSAWAFSPVPASASRCCCRCWRAMSSPISPSSGRSASAASRCRNFCRTIWGPAGLARSVVVVVSTSDEPALMRRQAAYLMLTIAEFFRDPCTMPRAADPTYLPTINRARQVMATNSDMDELIRLSAYLPGSSLDVDEAIALHKPPEAFLAQIKKESTSMAEGYQRLEQILCAAETEN